MSSGIIVQINMVLGIISLFDSGRTTDSGSKRGEEKPILFIFVSWLVGWLLCEERKERCFGTEISTLLWQNCIHLKS